MHLRDSIRHILAPHPTPAESSAYIDLTLRIASIYLLKRIGAGIINPAFFGLTSNDLAIDCCAPLFARDDQGCFTRLTTYYASLHWETLSDAELLGATRRLVFSSVHQQLVRLYRDHDPSLEKIIRNLRNALHGSVALREERRGGELWLCSTSETEEHRTLPEMPWAYLEGELAGGLQEHTPLREVMRDLAGIFEGQTVYRRSFPMTSLALLLRMAYSRFGTDPDDGSVTGDFPLRHEEMERIIGDALAGIGAEKRSTYVGKGKVDGVTYAAYLSAIRSILRSEFMENDGTDLSYHKHLQMHIPGLSMEHYREHHRCHLEYLAKLGRERFLEKMRKELLGTTE